jgi:hypothetical protein
MFRLGLVRAVLTELLTHEYAQVAVGLHRSGLVGLLRSGLVSRMACFRVRI